MDKEKQKEKESKEDKVENVVVVPFEEEEEGEELPIGEQTKRLCQWYSKLKDKEQFSVLSSLLSLSSTQQFSRLYNVIAPPLFRDFISSLPIELAYRILLLLPPLDLFISGHVCKEWRKRSSDNFIWKRKAFYYYSTLTLPPFLNLDWKQFYIREWAIAKNWIKERYTVSRLVGHTGIVLAIEILGKTVVSAAEDKTIRIWDLKHPSKHRVLKGHTSSVTCLMFNEDLIISGSEDKTIKYWDFKTGRCLNTLEGHPKSVLCLKFDSKHLVSGSEDPAIHVWDVKSGVLMNRLHGHTDSVSSIVIQNNIVVSGAENGEVKIWELNQAKFVRNLTGPKSAIISIQITTDKLAAGTEDSDFSGSNIYIWDLGTGSLLNILSGHSGGIFCLAFLNPVIIISGGGDDQIKVWDLKTSKCSRTLRGQTEVVGSLQFASGLLISGQDDCSMKVWNFSENAIVP